MPRPFKAKRLMAFKHARTRLELEQELKASDDSRPIDALVKEYENKGRYIRTLSRDDLGVELERCGLQGSPTKVHKVYSVVLTGEGYEQVPPTGEGIGKLLDSLIEERFFG
jgi:electron transfer flavoprotein beta subunit